MSKTRIEWSEFVWNPITGCTPCSPGCTHCFAERMARRLAGRYGYPKAPHHFDVTLHPDRLDIPLKRKKPTLYFVCSMSDLFHENVPFEFVQTVHWMAWYYAPQHTYQWLTKRPARALEYISWLQDKFPSWTLENLQYTFSNIWLGVSVENQAAADARREDLERCPAAVKFVSYEPALGPVDWTGWEFVSQIISGGESGPGARPSHPDWHRATRDFCQENGIAYFFKAWGAWGRRKEAGITLNDGPFGYWDDGTPGYNEWVAGGFASHGEHMVRVGKKRAGHLLDGREHQEFPR